MGNMETLQSQKKCCSNDKQNARNNSCETKYYFEIMRVTNIAHIEIYRYNFGREVTFSIQVAIIATSNTPLNIII